MQYNLTLYVVLHMLSGSINLKLIQLVFWQFIVDMIEKNVTSFKKIVARSKIKVTLHGCRFTVNDSRLITFTYIYVLVNR